MRVLMLVVAVATMVAPAVAKVYEVPDENDGIFCIQDAIDLALSESDPATNSDLILITGGAYDSVRVFTTSLGMKSAVCGVVGDTGDTIVIAGIDQDDVVVDHTDADFGILFADASPPPRLLNLTVVGGVGRNSMAEGEPVSDDRLLNAAIACIGDTEVMIKDIIVEQASTGLIMRDGAYAELTSSIVARGGHDGIFVRDAEIYMSGVTVVDNFDNGIYIYQGSAVIEFCSVTHNSKKGIRGYGSDVDVSYCNVFWNDRPGDEENYGGDLEDLTGLFGNISSEPWYCDYTGEQAYDYHVCAESPNIVDQPATIGALGAGCGECVSPVQPATWGAIKSLFR